MKKKRAFETGIFFLSVLLIASFAWATHQPDQTVTLKAGPGGKGASGEAIIRDKPHSEEVEFPIAKEIIISAKGLKPDGVYTVWFVKMKPMGMKGIGTPDYVMKVDENGNGSYTATVSTNELRKWDMIEIAYHKDGDPKNMKSISAALKGALKKMEMKGM